MLKTMIIAGFGGFIGTCMRFLCGRLCNLIFSSSFPIGTFLVNMTGCFIIGILFGMVEKSHTISPQMNILLITGFCGGFTTFSTFTDDMYLLLQHKQWLYFGLYAGLSLAVGLLLVWLGRLVVKIS